MAFCFDKQCGVGFHLFVGRGVPDLLTNSLRG